jgi:hypothetical protein
MNTDRDLREQAARRERGRRLAWIAAGVAILATLMLQGPAPDRGAPDTASRLLEQQAPAMPRHVTSLSSQIDWDVMPASPDPSPMSVAAYDR